MLAYVDWWKGLDDSGYYTYSGLQRDWDGTTAAYFAKEVAMIITSSSDVTLIDEGAAGAGFANVASFMPYNGDVDYVGNLIGGATIWMVDGMEQKTEDGALAFMNFFSNPCERSGMASAHGLCPDHGRCCRPAQ